MTMKNSGTIYMACIACILLAMAETVSGENVRKIKTTYKQYSIYTDQGRDILCEPYVVQKGDWLYKIFKQKGEISENDFPFFISIFKQINPHIHDIDAIATGTRILIPLKIKEKLDYAVDKDGTVKIPVVEFHDTKNLSVPRFSVQKHTTVPGDTVSALLDPVFLDEGGNITLEGQTLFYLLNPHIKNIHRIYPGDRINIPLPSMQDVSPPPRVSTVPTPVGISSGQLQRLKAYADTLNGKLTHQGKLYFPGRNGRKEIQVDLSETPLIETDEPGKPILILPGHSSHHPLLDKAAQQSIASYWGNIRVLPMEAIVPQRDPLKPESSNLKTHLSRKQMVHILTQAGFDHVPDDIIRFHVNHIPVSTRLDRIKRPNRPDLLVNFGTVFGQGIEAIQQKNFDVLSFNLKQTRQEQVQDLLSALGYHVWQNPSFTHQGTVETLPGIYGEQASSRLFVSWAPTTPIVRSFLEARQITHVSLQSDTPAEP
jgi:hypothetical protein